MRSPIRRAAVARLLAAALVVAASLATASEPGSGVYALDCASSDETYRISIRGDGSAEVQRGETTFMELLTSYSYFGNRTPNNFLVAVLFDPEASPIAAGPDGSPRIELWSGESAYYALINGDTKQRLDYCGPLSTPGAAADMPYSTDDYDAVGYLDCQLVGSEDPACLSVRDQPRRCRLGLAHDPDPIREGAHPQPCCGQLYRSFRRPRLGAARGSPLAGNGG